MSYEKNRPPFTPEDYPPGSSDYPWTKPPKERVPEAQSHTLSPEDQVMLKELMQHWQKAKEANNTEKIIEATRDIGELIGRRVDDADLVALDEALNEPEEKWGEEYLTVEEIFKSKKLPKVTAERVEEPKGIAETVGRERTRYGVTLPSEISPERRRVLEEGGMSKKTKAKFVRHLRKEAGKRGDVGKKPMWKTRRSQKRKTKLAA